MAATKPQSNNPQLAVDQVCAVILAGGLGTRLRSVVSDRPKPMAEIAGRPFLEHQILNLKRYGIANFVLCVGYMHEKIEAYFGDGSAWGVSIEYSIEEDALGTGGAIKLAERYVNSTFLVFNGDTFFNIDLEELLSFHAERKALQENTLGTLVLTEVEDPSAFGTVEADADGKVTCFKEKTASDKSSNLISAGIYLLEPEFLAHIPTNQKVSIECETFPVVLDKGFALYGTASGGYFVDIGSPEGYQDFQDYMEEVDL